MFRVISWVSTSGPFLWYVRRIVWGGGGGKFWNFPNIWKYPSPIPTNLASSLGYIRVSDGPLWLMKIVGDILW